MIAARLYTERGLAEISPGWFVPAALTAAIMLWGFNHFGGGWYSSPTWKIAWPVLEGVVWAGFIVTYLAAGRLLPRAIAWSITKLGVISYSAYLIHFTVITAVINQQYFVRLTGNGYYDALLTTLFVVSPIVVLIATLTYNTIELPFLEMRPRYVLRQQIESSTEQP